MNLSKSDNRIFRLLKLLLAACLLTPLLVASGVIFPYTVPKVFAFRALVEIAAVGYLYLALRHPAQFFSVFAKKSNPLNPPLQGGQENTPLTQRGVGGLEIAVIAFLFVSLLAAIGGLDFYNSWWGNLERGMGVWGLLHFVGWFFMLVGVMNADAILPPLATLYKGRQNVYPPYAKGGWGVKLLQISVFTSAVIALLAIGQHFFGLGDLLPRVDRVYSTIGNAAFLGTYLVFNIFLTGYLALESLRPRLRYARGFGEASSSGGSNPAENLHNDGIAASPRRCGAPRQDSMMFIVYCLLLIVDFSALLLSGTRGAWLGLAAGLVVLFAFLFLSPRFKGGWGGFKKWPPIFLAVMLILLGSLLFFRDFAFIKNNSIFYRLTSLSLSNATAQSRLILWQSAWPAWQVRPILGSGPENFEAATSPYLSPRLTAFEAFSLDRAHNFIFDYGVTIGWLGLLGYLSMIAATVFAFWRFRSENFIFFAIFASLLAAYLVQNLFIFDSFVSYLMLFFILAMISGICYRKSISVIPAEAGIQIKSWPGSRLKAGMTKKIVFTLFTIFIFFSIYSFSFKPLLASRRANSLLSLPLEASAQAAPLLKDALALNTFASPEIAYQSTLDYIDRIALMPLLAEDEEFYGAASRAFREEIERSPARVRNYIALSWLDLYFFGRDSARMEEAITLGRKILELNPIRKDAYLILTAGYALSGQPAMAEEIILQAKAIDDKMGEEVKGYYEKLQ